MADSILELLEDRITVPNDLREEIRAITDSTILAKLVKLAARTNSLEEFREKMSEITQS